MGDSKDNFDINITWASDTNNKSLWADVMFIVPRRYSIKFKDDRLQCSNVKGIFIDKERKTN